MKLGVCVPNYGETGTKKSLTAVACEAEKVGFDSVWCTDHLLMTKNSGTPYESILESITTIAFLAAATTKVKLGISSLIIPMRNPIVVAKQLATIDNLSGGRLILATGAGWNEAEFSNLGSNFHNRGKRLDESIRMLRDLWSGKTVFQSKHLKQEFQDAVFQPRPVQQHLPIWIGGSSAAAMRRAVKLGDAWHPNVQPLDKFVNTVGEFKRISSEAGVREICVRIGLNPKSDKSEWISPQGEKRVILTTNAAENRRLMDRLEELGVSYAVVAPSPNGKFSERDQVEGLRLIAKDFL